MRIVLSKSLVIIWVLVIIFEAAFEGNIFGLIDRVVINTDKGFLVGVVERLNTSGIIKKWSKVIFAENERVLSLRKGCFLAKI